MSPLSSKEHAALRRVLPFLFAVAAVAAGPVAGAAAAAPRAVFAVQPLQTRADHGYFILDARPGETIRRSVRIVNTGGRAGTVRLDAVDATTGQTTGAVYLDRKAPRRGVGGWITPSTGEVRLTRGQSRTVALTIRVPRQARDGQHLGGVVAESVELTRGLARKRGRSSFRVDVRSQTIVAVQLNLPGKPQERMALTSVRPGGSAGRQTLLVGLRNEGNRLVKGRGDVVITDARGARLRHARFNVDTFVPSTAVADPVAVPRRALPVGKYRADVTLRYGEGHVARLSTPFAISRKQVAQVFGSQPQQSPLAPGSGTPLLAIVLGAIALLAVGFLAAFLYLRRRLAGHAAALPADRQPRR
ncbi:MAG: hypothetical protein QOJ21_2148 [Solirubrobacteraceae bacterium]|jgi:hypothetical protein|nr:hypothetical protein [Solirubrobacteraceae bacterium]